MVSEEEKNKSLNEYIASSYETLKYLKKKRKKRIILFIIGIVLFLFFILYGPFSYMFIAKKKLRFYEVQLNNLKLSVSEKIENTTIIPFVLEIPKGNSYTFSVKDADKKITINKEPYLLSINSYTCFLTNNKEQTPISCPQKIEAKYENHDTTYTKMQILQYDYDSKYQYSISGDHLSRSYYIDEYSIKSRPYEEYSIVYEGNYVNDLTAYINKRNVYVIKITFKYQNTKGTISFGIVNNGNDILAL